MHLVGFIIKTVTVHHFIVNSLTQPHHHIPICSLYNLLELINPFYCRWDFKINIKERLRLLPTKSVFNLWPYWSRRMTCEHDNVGRGSTSRNLCCCNYFWWQIKAVSFSRLFVVWNIIDTPIFRSLYKACTKWHIICFDMLRGLKTSHRFLVLYVRRS